MGGVELSREEIDQMTSKLEGIVESVKTGIAGTGPGSTGAGGVAGVFDSLSCQPGSDCYKTKHTKYLLDKYIVSNTAAEQAPILVSRAEKNYLLYNEGNSGGQQLYDDFIIDRFSTTAQDFKANSIEKQQEYMADIAQHLKQYQAADTFQEQSRKLFKMRQEEQVDLKKNLNYYQKIVQTSERKVVYENKNMDTLYTYRRIMLFLYYGGIVCYIIFGNFIPEKLYLKYTVWLILVIVSIVPIILNISVIWMFLFYDTLAYWFADFPHKDVYKDLGNPADDPAPKPPVSFSSGGIPIPAASPGGFGTPA